MTSIGKIAELDGSGTNNVLTVTKPVPAGGVVAVAAAINTAMTSAPMTDNRGNTYTVSISGSGGSPVCRLVVGLAVLATALQVGDTISVGPMSNTPSKQPWVAAAWSGLAASPVDLAMDLAAGSTGAATSGATGTLAQADEILVQIVGATQALADTMSQTGWTLEADNITPDGTNDKRCAIWSKVVSSTASTTPSVTLSNAPTTWASAVTSLKLAAAPPAGLTFSEWDGTTEHPGLTITEWWDGTALQPIASLEVTP